MTYKNTFDKLILSKDIGEENMTKKEMLEEMMKGVSLRNPEATLKNLMKNSKVRIERAYNVFTLGKQKGVDESKFCIAVLTVW